MANEFLYGFYTKAKLGVTGLTVTIDVKSLKRSDSTVATVATAAAMTELAFGGYFYALVNPDLLTYDYFGRCHTADATVDQQDVAALRSDFTNAAQTGDNYSRIGAAGAGLTALGDARIANLDAAVSSRSTYAGGAVASVTGNVGGSVGNLAVGAQTDVQSALTAQGFTAARAAFLDVLNGLVAAVWAAATRTLTAFGFNVTVGTNNDKTGYSLTAGEEGLIAVATWLNGVRTLTVPATQPQTVVSGAISIYRDTSVSIAITGLGPLTGNTKLWFTVKKDLFQADSAAILQIERTQGTLVLNGTVTGLTPGDGVITVNDVTLGNITITLAAGSAAKLPVIAGVTYDVKMLTSSGVTELAIGPAQVTISATATRAIS